LRVARVAGRPLERFLQIEAASGILLLLAAAIALTLANSRWAAEYAHFWHTPVGIRVGAFAFERTLEWYVNDGLMVIFFFVVGMEIRREIHHGELSEWRRASLPIAAAAGGMVAPAALYLLLDREPRAHAGWGVPMATDIAFAVGILALLGKRVPPALRVLLLALAVIDDLGAIFVIAVFYTHDLDPSGFVVAACGFAGIFAMQRLGVRLKLAYVFPSVVAWAGVYAAGVHPTIAGVIVGLVTPVRAWLGPQGFIAGIREDLDRLSASMQHRASPHELAATLRHVDLARREAMSPAESLIESLHPWVAYGIMPVFALANAGVTLSGGALDSLALGVSVAVAAGLAVGKPVGILLAMGILIRLRWGQLPLGITLRHTLVLGCVAGVGFTMSLFIAQLAFTDDQLLAGAKIGVLSGSLVAGVFALVLGKLLLRPDMVAGAATTADEAESSTEA
jgi:NhaA family Na+:H+ antiporter